MTRFCHISSAKRTIAQSSKRSSQQQPNLRLARPSTCRHAAALGGQPRDGAAEIQLLALVSCRVLPVDFAAHFLPASTHPSKLYSTDLVSFYDRESARPARAD